MILLPVFWHKNITYYVGELNKFHNCIIMDPGYIVSILFPLL